MPSSRRRALQAIDLNLLRAFSVLVTARSVSKAAQQLHLSESATSRTLARVREAFGDPILVRAGRELVVTPRALALQPRVRLLLDEAQALLSTQSAVGIENLQRTFTVRCNEGFAVEYGARLLTRMLKEAPSIRLRFVVNVEKSADALREDRADLEIGVLGKSGPEIRLQTLLRDRFVGVVAANHPLSRRPTVRLQDYVRYSHISVSRRGLAEGPIDLALRAHDTSRTVAAVVSSFPAALAIARQSQMIANVPQLQTTFNRVGLHTFELPIHTEEVVVSMMWHPKTDADPSHQWLRQCIREVCSKYVER